MLSVYKISGMQCKGNVFKLVVERMGAEKCVFLTEKYW